MAATSIQWCDHSINPIRARDPETGAVGHYCEKVAAGCTHCYSSTLQRRFKMPSFGSGQKRDNLEIFLDESKLEEVRRRKKPTKFFWCDMTDIFGGWMKPEWLAACFATMDATPQHTHLLLTKRPENIRRMWPVAGRYPDPSPNTRGPQSTRLDYYRHNVWIGTSIATQSDADRNIPELLKCRDLSPVLFVSAEPLIEQIYFRSAHLQCKDCESGTYDRLPEPCTGRCGIDWLIIGGESGPHARPCDVSWIRSLMGQAAAADVPVFVKQLGSRCVIEHATRSGLVPLSEYKPHGYAIKTSAGNLAFHAGWFHSSDPKGGNWSEWPVDLRVREMPKVEAAHV